MPDDAERLEPQADAYAPVRRARQRFGIAGAALAGAMVALRDLLEKPKDDAAVVVDSPSEPVDLDGAGITVTVDGRASASVAPQHRPVADPDEARRWTNEVLRRNRRRGRRR